MNFTEIALARESCRNFDASREVEQEKLEAILEAGRLSPSACNGQPYHFTVCKGDAAARVAKCVMGMGMNRFAADAPVLIVISEEPYVKTAAFGAKIKKNDYRSEKSCYGHSRPISEKKRNVFFLNIREQQSFFQNIWIPIENMCSLSLRVAISIRYRWRRTNLWAVVRGWITVWKDFQNVWNIMNNI